ncbi:MAG: MFS transporter, partial [Dehalococcoidia bacterium]|nr:MFS transporter [Dehalococcoidia bacterium]
PAGAWVDRLRRRPVLIATDLGRALLLGSIPLAALLGFLRIEHLYLVALLASVLTVFFDVAAGSYLPAIVSRGQLVEGNSKLAASESLAQIAGPGVGGVLVQLITAPLTILVDAISFLVSALSLRLIRAAEPAPTPADPEQRIWHEIGDGLRLLMREPVLRAFAGCSGTLNGFGGVFDALFKVYAIRHLAISPALLGTIFSLGSVAWFLGAVLVNRVTLRLGQGQTMLLGALLIGIANLLVPLAGVLLGAVLPLLVCRSLLLGIANPLYNVTSISMRQALTPPRLLGRVNASMEFIGVGTLPLGALVGGALAEMLGVWNALMIGALGGLVAVFWLVLSPVRSLRSSGQSHKAVISR